MFQNERDRASFATGAHALAAVLRPVLGSTGRCVVVEGMSGTSKPESLTDGATIATRVTGIPGRLSNTGAMFLRGLLQEVEREAGDGATTTAVMFDAMLREGQRAVAAGFDSVVIRRHLLQLATAAEDILESQRRMPSGQDDLARVATGVCGDARIASAIGEVIATYGPECLIEVRPDRHGDGPVTWLDEPYWPTTSLGGSLVLDHHGLRRDLRACAVLLSDCAIERPDAAIAIVAAAKASGASSLLVIARALSSAAAGVLAANASQDFAIAAVKTPGSLPKEQYDVLTDLSIMTGGRILLQAAQPGLTGLRPEMLGQCRRAWVAGTHFGIFGGNGASQAIRQHIRHLRHRRATVDDREQEKQVAERLARLTNKGAIVWVNAATDRDRERLEHLAARAIRVTSAAASLGIVPGGGSAYRTCAERLERQGATGCDPEERAALRILRSGLLAPSIAIADNRGEASSEQTPLDSAQVASTAVRLAAHGVAQALTIDAFVLRKSPARATTR